MVEQVIKYDDVRISWDDVTAEEVVDAKWCEIGVQEEFDTFEPILQSKAREEGFKEISTKWHLTLGPDGVKARFVAR